MQEALLGSGHTITTAEADADAHVLVTCTVVETTERKMARRLAELAVYEKPFVVAGCMAAAQRERVQSIVPRAKLLPPRKWPQIVELLGAGTACGDRAAEVDSASFGWRDAIVPIAQGCAGRCTYCITRVARGTVASYGIDSIVGQVRRHVERGVREIKLTGQDTAAYGLDSGTNLAALLRAIAEIPGEFRVRVGMADPLTVYPIQEELVAAYACDKMFKFLHLPVQSGDDTILESMRRQYTVSEFEEIVGRFRLAFPEITLSTDVIVGFPGESEEQFEATMELIRRVRPDIVNVTRFSPRDGTPAATMPGQIVGWKVKERSRRLTRLRFRGHGLGHGAGQAGHRPRADAGIPPSRPAGTRDHRRISPGGNRRSATDGSLRTPVDQWTLYGRANPRWQPRGVAAKHSGLWNPRRQFESARGYSDEGSRAAPPHVRRCSDRRGGRVVRLPRRRRIYRDHTPWTHDHRTGGGG